MPLILVLGKLEAYHDLWIIGDQFLKEIIDTLFTLRSKGAAMKPLKIPYLFSEFNVSAYYTTSRISNIINKFLFSFVEGLNTREKLPKYILIVADSDIIKGILCDMGISVMIGAALHGIIMGIDTYIQRCRIDLLDKKPGAAIGDGHPKIIWIRMLKRAAELTTTNKVFSMQGKFNAILEE